MSIQGTTMVGFKETLLKISDSFTSIRSNFPETLPLYADEDNVQLLATVYEVDFSRQKLKVCQNFT